MDNKESQRSSRHCSVDRVTWLACQRFPW